VVWQWKINRKHSWDIYDTHLPRLDVHSDEGIFSRRMESLLQPTTPHGLVLSYIFAQKWQPSNFSSFPPNCSLKSYLTSFEETTNLRMTCRKYRGFITRPSFAKLLEIEPSPWVRDKQLYSCCYCVRLRQSNKFAERILRYRKRSHVYPRFYIECGLKVPCREPGPRGYNRGHKLEVGVLEYPSLQELRFVRAL